ncbi:hypothetical protein CAP36_04535 [Chitinophagaceae bacterium IBVUCB2]|nr:hypothetical protein CAP36_04535 [Chitinophagaceae bacterium IBVUCB2]
MKYAFVNVPAAPVRRKPLHRKEMINQLLFGEAVQVLKTKGDLWVKIRGLHDGYEGWITNTLIEEADELTATTTSSFATMSLLDTLTVENKKINIPVGSSLPFFTEGKGKLGKTEYAFAGKFCKRDDLQPSPELVKELTQPWLNAPYLWGGRTPLGVDCSGFVQVVFKLMGIDMSRDAWQQAQAGIPVKKFSEVRTGDLAFFASKEDITHVGILLDNGEIIHASGKVRIDTIDKKGIISADTGKRTLRLRAVRRVW